MTEQEQQLISNQPLMNPFVFRVNDEKHELEVYGSYDNPWSPAYKLGNILGIQNIRQNLQGLDEDWKADVCLTYGRSGSKKTTLINEMALYHIIMRSDKPIAKEFQKWVYGVIKQIRQTGSYHMNSKIKNEMIKDETRYIKKVKTL